MCKWVILNLERKPNEKEKDDKAIEMPSAEEVAQELGKATSIDDFYGKDGIFSRLFSKTIKQKILALYAKGMSTRDIQEMLEEL